MYSSQSLPDEDQEGSLLKLTDGLAQMPERREGSAFPCTRLGLYRVQGTQLKNILSFNDDNLPSPSPQR